MHKDCTFCQIIVDPSKPKLYEDDKIVVLLHTVPAAQGHILIMPKEHYPIIEQVPDYIVSHAFTYANRMSTLLFETLNIQGTNILVHNGIEAGQEAAHFMIHVIPRMQDDGLNLQWQPKQVADEEMETLVLLLQEETKSIGQFEEEKKEVEVLQKPEMEGVKEEKDKKNYMLEHIQRKP